MAPDAGCAWPPLAGSRRGCWLGVENDESSAYDEEDRALGDYRAVATALATTEERATAAEERATTAADRLAAEAEARAALEARLREVEEELRKFRG